jgi:hypothetical protein
MIPTMSSNLWQKVEQLSGIKWNQAEASAMVHFSRAYEHIGPREEDALEEYDFAFSGNLPELFEPSCHQKPAVGDGIGW